MKTAGLSVAVRYTEAVPPVFQVIFQAPSEAKLRNNILLKSTPQEGFASVRVVGLVRLVGLL